MFKKGVSASLFDVCLPCYVTDWSGIVLQAPVSHDSTHEDIIDGLNVEDLWDHPDVPEWVTDDMLREAVRKELVSCRFDASAELEESPEEEEGYEFCYVFFRIEIDEEDDDE